MEHPPFHSRELSWLAFNRRVLEEARKKQTPVLDRLRFLSITASNLDEFFMVRVAGLRDKTKGKDNKKTDDAGLTPQAQLHKVLETARAFQLEQAACLEDIVRGMAEKGVTLLSLEELDRSQLTYAQALFHDEVLPVLTPLAVDPGRPFPFLANKSLNIGVRLQDNKGEDQYALVQVPSLLPRFLPLPSRRGWAFLPLEQLIAKNLESLFGLHELQAYGFFRITRSADYDASESTDNLLEEMERTIKKRRRGKAVRLEVSCGFDPLLGRFLTDILDIGKKYIFSLPLPLDLAPLGKIASLPGADHLRLPPILPAPAGDFCGCEDIFAAIRKRDRMVHHPYEAFAPVEEFIRAAAEDDAVLAIKQTLYRVSGNSQVVAALEKAGENGKQVTVFVELKARFDEENNILWAKRLEKAGCHVIYGLTGLKTHCKICLVVRREEEGLRRYVHLGTGNYNDATAALYTDIGLFTCSPAIGEDASALFNHITGFSKAPAYEKLVAAPEGLRPFLLEKIAREAENARRGLPCGITIKVNSLLDGGMVRALYEASGAGVPIRLLIRGICSLIPGVEGFSERIRVKSLVGQLLEHSRIFAFENGGEPLFYLGSADLMPRNLDRRVELVFPVEEPVLRQRLCRTLELLWNDTTNAREQDSRGRYHGAPRGTPPRNAQRELARLAAAGWAEWDGQEVFSGKETESEEGL